MKKSYSGLNLLQKKLAGISDEYKGFFDYFISNRKYLTLTLPYYDYIRGCIFIDDLRENFGDEIPYSLDIATLIFILYDDFMRQIKRGLAENKDIAAYLAKGKEKYFLLPKKEKRVMKALTKNLFEFETIAEDEEINNDPDDKKAHIQIRIKESEILRAEILIHELTPYLKDIKLNVEQLISIVFLEFINNIKNEGNSLKIQKSILVRLKRDY